MVRAHSLCLAPGGRQLFACAKGAPAVTCWDLAADRPVTRFAGPGKEPLHVAALSRDGKLLAATYSLPEENGVLLWDVPSRRLLRKAPTALGQAEDVVFSPDGQHVACGCHGGTVLLDTAELRTRLFVGGRAYSLAFSPDSRILAIPDYYGWVVRLWNIRVTGRKPCWRIRTSRTR
jgi:WD40 repeat protein